MADQELKLTVRVNAETGQLEVLGAKMKEAGDKATSAWKSFLPAIGAASILGFFASAIKGAEEQNQSLQRLKFTIESNGGSWAKSAAQIDIWAKAIGQASRFSDGQALAALDKLTLATGNVTQGQAAAELAMRLSTKTGKELTETTQTLTDLINGHARAVLEAHKEYGTFAGNGKTAQSVLDSLTDTLKNTSLAQESLTDSSTRMRNSFDQFKDVIGQFIIPALTNVFDFLTSLINKWEDFAIVVSGAALKIGAVFAALSASIKDAMTLDFSGAKEELKNIPQDVAAVNAAIDEEQAETDAKRKQQHLKSVQDRVNVNAFGLQEENRLRAEANASYLELTNELEQKIQSLGVQTYQKKLAALNSEVEARRAKINKELQDEAQKQKALDKLNQYQKAASTQLAKEEISIETQRAFDTVNTAIQTFQVLNSMGEKGSSSERARAKALLALQQAVTIGWIWVGASKAAADTGLLASPGIAALAAAQTGLAIANFASQSKAIDQSAAREHADISGISINPSAPGIDLGGVSPSLGSGAVTISSGSGVGGSGGAGATIINVGGVVVNFDISKLSVDNADAIMMGVVEKVRQGTVEAVQLALQLDRLAVKNSKLAS
jgi:hypothetical protein